MLPSSPPPPAFLHLRSPAASEVDAAMERGEDADELARAQGRKRSHQENPSSPGGSSDGQGLPLPAQVVATETVERGRSTFLDSVFLCAGFPSWRSRAGRVRAQQPTGLGGPWPLQPKCQSVHPQVNGHARPIDSLHEETNQRRGSFTRFPPTLSPFPPPSRTTTCEMESDQPPVTPSMLCACYVLALCLRGLQPKTGSDHRLCAPSAPHSPPLRKHARGR